MHDPVQAAIAALAQYFVGDRSLGETLTRVCTAALDAVPEAHAAGITMTVDGADGTVVFTHPEVQQVDRVQYQTGDGPCLTAFHHGTPVIIESTAEDGPFPKFRAVARSHNILSVLSTPMQTHNEVVGALNLYADEERAFRVEHLEHTVAFATQAAFLLVNSKAYWDARTLSENLAQAMASRAVIEQAKGIIMGSTGLSATAAFDHLRRLSQFQNVKVRDVAEEMVRRSRRHQGDPG